MLLVGRPGVALVHADHLVEHPLLLAFFIYDKDTCFPFGIGAWDVEAGIGDEGRVARWDPESYCPYHHPAFTLVTPSSC